MFNEVVIFITTSSKEEAQRIGDELVKTNLVACVNIVSPVQSIFRWKGQFCKEDEILMVLKSVTKNLDSIIARVKSLHSYEVPEIIALPIIGGSEEYLNWVRAETETV